MPLDSEEYTEKVVETRLNTPYGATELVHQRTEIGDTNGLVHVKVDEEMAFDAEKIATGVYTPLTGFLNEEELNGVIDNMSLPNGMPWTIPFILAPKSLPRNVKKGENIVIDYKDSPVAMVEVSETYKLDKNRIATQVFGVNDVSHPNVKELVENYGDTAIAGKVYLIAPPKHPLKEFELSPNEVRRKLFEMKFGSVAAFQCRNPPHRGHEYIQRMALENAEALLIHPVLGKLKNGDYRPEIIYHTYRYFVDNYFPSDRVLLSPLLISMRYAGPRSAVLFAIIRRNFGCTHFTVGRDMSGVGGLYEPYAAHRLFQKFEDKLNMKFIFFNEIGYCKRCGQIVSDRNCTHSDHQIKISQTAIRDILSKGEKPPEEMIRSDIAEKILEFSRKFGGTFVKE